MHDLTAFETAQPLASLALRQGVLQQKMAHGLLLTGQPVGRMLQMVQTLYRAMACEAAPALLTACQQCRSCRWMARNAHPGFMTISPLSFFVEEDSTGHVQTLTPEQASKLLAKPPTQIKVAQIRYLQEQLSHKAGDYPRMVVFCDAASQPAADNADPQPYLPPYDWASLPAAEGQQWQPLPLNRSLFNVQSANRFLKTLEEPGPHTYFVFLAQQQDDMLPTIVSRCQVVPFLPEPDLAPPYPAELATFWQGWFQRPTHPAVGLKQFTLLMQTTGHTAEQTLQQTLAWVRHTQKSQWVQPLPARQWMQFARTVSHVEEMLSHHVSQEHALLRLFCP